jgi:probable HAF family extracellular repeat protein
LILLAIIASMAAPVHAGELTINNNTQVVGFSQDQYGNNTVAWIWQNGHLTKLNTTAVATMLAPRRRERLRYLKVCKICPNDCIDSIASRDGLATCVTCAKPMSHLAVRSIAAGNSTAYGSMRPTKA